MLLKYRYIYNYEEGAVHQGVKMSNYFLFLHLKTYIMRNVLRLAGHQIDWNKKKQQVKLRMYIERHLKVKLECTLLETRF